MGEQSVRDGEELTVLGGGVVLILLLAGLGIAMTNWGGRWGVAGIGLTVVLASLMTGSLLGFLFSVPRVLAQAARSDPADLATPDDDPGRRLLQTNTNLEKISDWLTTMLVGVGLSQLGNLNEGLRQFSLFIAGYRGASAAQVNGLAIAAPMLLLVGGIVGFVGMYLYTRIILVRILNSVEDGLVTRLPKQVQRVVAAAAQQAKAEGATSAAIAAAADPSTPVTPKDSVNVMFDLLYQPEGFRQVIQLGQQLVTTSAANDADFWFYLAAAYGQALTDAKSRDDSAGAELARAKALEAAERAVRISPSYRSRLWAISDPKGVDDDLAPLRTDEAFVTLVKR